MVIFASMQKGQPFLKGKKGVQEKQLEGRKRKRQFGDWISSESIAKERSRIRRCQFFHNKYLPCSPSLVLPSPSEIAASGLPRHGCPAHFLVAFCAWSCISGSRSPGSDKGESQRDQVSIRIILIFFAGKPCLFLSGTRPIPKLSWVAIERVKRVKMCTFKKGEAFISSLIPILFPRNQIVFPSAAGHPHLVSVCD